MAERESRGGGPTEVVLAASLSALLLLTAACGKPAKSLIQSNLAITSKSMIAEAARKRDKFLASCFRDEGFTFTVRTTPVHLIGVFPLVTEGELRQVERAGYGISESLAAVNQEVDPNLLLFTSLSPSEKTAYVVVQKKCNLAQSKQEMGLTEEFFNKLSTAQSRYLTLPETSNAMRTWSQCMTRSGIPGTTTRNYKFADLVQKAVEESSASNGSGLSGSASDRNMAVELTYARADVKCLRPVYERLRSAWYEAIRR